jgi:hypothetical protein
MGRRLLLNPFKENATGLSVPSRELPAPWQDLAPVGRRRPGRNPLSVRRGQAEFEQEEGRDERFPQRQSTAPRSGAEA